MPALPHPVTMRPRRNTESVGAVAVMNSPADKMMLVPRRKACGEKLWESRPARGVRLDMGI